MNIVHICLANYYVDGMGYQENLLTKFHAKNNKVTILTSDFSFDNRGQTIRKVKKFYQNEYDIPVIVLNKSRRFGPYSKYRDYDKLYKTLAELNPDVIFCHGGQFVALMDIVRYCKKHSNVKLYIDQHGDYYNSPVKSLRQKVGHKWIYGHWIRKAVPYTEKFWGVTPWRCQYLHEIYGVPEEKIGLLVMGGDDDKIHFDNQIKIRQEIRNKYNISESDFLIITGGKIDRTKNIHLVIKAIKEMNIPNVKLLVFGQPSNDFEEEFLSEINGNNQIIYIGWIQSDTVYNYFLSSDLCIFPGTHSVLWEQACSCGLPGIFKAWEGMNHVDLNGSALFLQNDSVDEIKEKLSFIINNPKQFEIMKNAAQRGKVVFSYREIAKRALDGVV